jgi:hypothetical protein
MMRPFKGVRKTESLFLPAVALACAGGISWGILVNSAKAPAERAAVGRPVQAPDGGYTSSDACRACHPSQYASWHTSYHRTMTQLATPSTVLPAWDGVTVEDPRGARTEREASAERAGVMQLERDGQTLWAEFVDPDDPDGAARRIRRQVVLTTGSHNQQIYWYATGNSRVLGQLPAIWLTKERTWIPRRAAIMAPPASRHVSETGAWNAVCVACHATNGRPQLDAPFGSRPIATLAADTRAVEFGIACETCHGPGQAHASANRNPLRRYGLHFRSAGSDDTIVQPARLDPQRASQVCGQCHAFWEFPDASSERHANSDGMPYRPGDELADTRFIVQPNRNLDTPTMQALLAQDAGFIRDTFWSDGMVRATGREYNGLLDSPCYKNAPADGSRTMTCFSCHAMHKPADDSRAMSDWSNGQLAPRALGNGACAECHRTTSQHSHHGAESAGSSCVECHMPHTTYGLLKTIRSHQISSPSVAATVATGRPNACNLCHLDKTLAWTADFLERWYRVRKPSLDADEQSVAGSVLWLLKGDAGQRAIVAQAMGRLPAQLASGSTWLAPYLALTQKDRYDAVRIIATRSLKTLPAFRRDQLPPGNPALLIKADGTFDEPRVNRLVRERDNRRLVYRE